jgi:hypothetical protein
VFEPVLPQYHDPHQEDGCYRPTEHIGWSSGMQYRSGCCDPEQYENQGEAFGNERGVHHPTRQSDREYRQDCHARHHADGNFEPADEQQAGGNRSHQYQGELVQPRFIEPHREREASPPEVRFPGTEHYRLIIRCGGRQKENRRQEKGRSQDQSISSQLGRRAIGAPGLPQAPEFETADHHAINRQNQ